VPHAYHYAGRTATNIFTIVLSSLRWKSKVEITPAVDIVLLPCVQGSCLNVMSTIHIKKCSKKIAPLLLSHGKVTVGITVTGV
jgi:hypothetical protein